MSQDDHHNTSETAAGLALILLTLAGWTAVPILIFMFKDDVDPWTANGWRYAFAALLWSPLLIYKIAFGKWSRGLLLAALVPGLCNALGQIVFTYSLYKVEPAVMSFGLRFQIVAVTALAAIFFPPERRIIRKPLFIAGLALLALGVFGTAASGGILDSKSGLEGMIYAIAAGGMFGCYALAVRGFMKHFGAFESFAVVSQLTAATMLVLMFTFGTAHGTTAVAMAALDPGRFGLFLLSAVIGIAAGHVLYYLAIRNLGVTVSSGVVQLQPFTIGIVSSLPLLAHFEGFRPLAEIKGLTPLQWLTGAVAVGGAILMIVVQHAVKQADKRAAMGGTGVSPVADDIEAFEDLPPDAIASQTITEHEGELEDAAAR
ncbi:MAG: DMT family transporter [Planctomycetota bacterium]